MNIVVLGASGQVGSVILQGLKSGHNVVGTSRHGTSTLLAFDPFADDWASLGKPDVIINCIGQIEPKVSSGFERIHVELISLLLANRATLGRPRIIQISALGARKDHAVAFLRTKAVGDELLLQVPNTVVLRPSIICTNRTMLVKKMLILSAIARYTGVICLPRGVRETKLQPVMPDDLVDVIKVVLNPVEEKIINVVGPKEISLNELLKRLSVTRHQRPLLIDMPQTIMNMLMRYLVEPLNPRLLNLQQYQLLFENNVADSQQIQKLLGRSANPVDDFFNQEFEYANH
ncbi:hypothetical protein WBG78_22615 [Chryseolinea sp. T2]|uniref:hypothetical protein n=1 Tax=Chryseolinea sp. T2 TaxID=3129255 RepID=UPI003076B11F